VAKGKTQRKLAPRVSEGGARTDKVAAVSDFKDRYGRSEAVVLTEYRGLNVNELGDLRERLRKADADYKVYKNTLATIAVRELGIDELSEMLEGPTATVFALSDPVAAAKALAEFAKDHELLVIKGGILGGKTLDAKAIDALSKLDSREVMLAKIAGLFVSPIQSFANVMKVSLSNLGSVLAQYRDKLPADGAAAPAAEAPATEAPAAEAAEAPAAEAAPEEAPAAEAATEEAPAAEATDAPAPNDGDSTESTETPSE